MDPLAGLTPPLDDRRFRWSVGTRPIPQAQWLCVEDADPQTLAYKKQLIADQPAGAVVVSDSRGTRPARELLDTVTEWLNAHHPEHHPRIGNTADADRSLDPIARVGQLVAEDFALLLPAKNTWVLVAASVCFPSRWDLASLLGEDLTGIHAAVPGYSQRIGPAVETVFDRIGGDTILSRSNWTLLDTSERHLPIAAAFESPSRPSGTVTLTDLRWLRIERQTLRALPESGAIVFTILTRIHDVQTLAATNQATLLRAVNSAPDDIRKYKGWPAPLG